MTILPIILFHKRLHNTTENYVYVFNVMPSENVIQMAKGFFDWLIDCFTAHQHWKAISAKKRC